MRLMSAVCAAALAASAVSMSSDAFAQRNRGQESAIVVVNYQRILAESTVGRDFGTKLQQMIQAINAEAQALAPEGQSIEEERARLSTSLRNQSQAQIQGNAQVQALAARSQQFQQRAATLQADLDCSRLIALRDLRTQISPVIRTIMGQRGAVVVIDASNALETDGNADVTTTVIQQLDQNQATRTANVSRRQHTECQGQQAQ
jgi:Skp family chaperone for outer membrane proteins